VCVRARTLPAGSGTPGVSRGFEARGFERKKIGVPGREVFRGGMMSFYISFRAFGGQLEKLW
jgi:hypothetical protein